LPLSLKCMPSILNAPVRRNRATGNVHLLYERSGDGCLPCPPLGYALPVAGGASSMWSLRRVGDTPIERPILPHPPPDTPSPSAWLALLASFTLIVHCSSQKKIEEGRNSEHICKMEQEEKSVTLVEAQQLGLEEQRSSRSLLRNKKSSTTAQKLSQPFRKTLSQGYYGHR